LFTKSRRAQTVSFPFSALCTAQNTAKSTISVKRRRRLAVHTHGMTTWASVGRWTGGTVLIFVVGAVGWVVWAFLVLATSPMFHPVEPREWWEQALVVAVPILTVAVSAHLFARVVRTRFRCGVLSVGAFWAAVVAAAQLLSTS
jgi:hypothetical protein